MSRIGDLMPQAAPHLGLEDELARPLPRHVRCHRRRAGAGGPRRLSRLRVDGETLLVEADAPIVGQELLLHGDDLAGAFRRAPGGAPVRQVRVTIRRR
jgi:hypothetical protein